MTDIEPYRITVPNAELADLQYRLSRARFPDELDAAEWDLGAPLEDVKRLIKQRADSYDRRRAEAQLNELPHYKNPIAVNGRRGADLGQHLLVQQRRTGQRAAVLENQHEKRIEITHLQASS